MKSKYEISQYEEENKRNKLAKAEASELRDQALKEKEQRKERLLGIYQSEKYQTLYRYDNPSEDYDESREGVTSKKEIIGQWYTDSPQRLANYIHMRKPGGSILLTRVLKTDLDQYDATKLDLTKDMDIENGNYVVPDGVSSSARLNVAFPLKSEGEKKFLFKEWKNIDEFVVKELSDEAILEKIREL